jgi:hypothetical protein
MTEEEIIQQLTKAHNTYQPVLLLNMFRGVPISREARITIISQGYIVLDVDPLQAVCIAIEKRTYIQSDFLAVTVRAFPVTIDVPKHSIVLHRFAIAERTFNERLSLRVQPKEPIKVTVYKKDKPIPTSIADISSKGVGIYSFSTFTQEKIEFTRNEPVEIAFILPHNKLQVQLKGKVSNITRQQGTIFTRIGVQTLPDSATEKALDSYIKNRQNEIMGELQRTYEIMAKK